MRSSGKSIADSATLLAGQVHQDLVRPGGGGGIGQALVVESVRTHLPCLALVVQNDLEQLPQTLAEGRRRDGYDHLDAAQKIAIHPVGGADEETALDRIGSSVLEVEDAGMLEEAADDRSHANALGEVWHARADAAEA